MTSLELANRYFGAWNSHDANAIVALFGDTGTYTDPTTNGALAGQATAQEMLGMDGFRGRRTPNSSWQAALFYLKRPPISENDP